MVDSAHDLETVLNRFSAATASWFRGAFAAPTPAQVGSWEAISLSLIHIDVYKRQVGITSIGGRTVSPRRITAPLPCDFSICAITCSSDFIF